MRTVACGHRQSRRLNASTRLESAKTLHVRCSLTYVKRLEPARRQADFHGLPTPH